MKWDWSERATCKKVDSAGGDGSVVGGVGERAKGGSRSPRKDTLRTEQTALNGTYEGGIDEWGAAASTEVQGKGANVHRKGSCQRRESVIDLGFCQSRGTLSWWGGAADRRC